MKSLLIGLASAIVLFAVAYLLGSFGEATFDVSKWNEGARYCIAGMGGVMSLAIGLVAGCLHNKSKEDGK